ncbi:MAG: TSUP family transporter [Patescibacteria group bacterium]
MQVIIGLMLLGVVAGILSGLIGIGGGVIIVPALVFLFGFAQQQAQGTTLALLVPPLGLLAVLSYYKHGYVNIHAALFIALGFILGSLIGARVMTQIPAHVLTRIFGFLILFIAVKMIFVR